VFNVETFGRVAALGPAIAGNLDPSHFFWMGMDGHKVAAALGDRIEHEDPFVPATTGVPEAARLLRSAIDAALEPV
jgi:hypothetical protein